MKYLRVSVSNLDALRQYQADEEADLDTLLARLAYKDEPTEAMKLGSAFHKVLERADYGLLDEVVMDDYRFAFTLDKQLQLSRVREVKGHYNIKVGETIVQVVGKVDELSGTTVVDHKLSSRVDIERWYLDSLQWRIYLEMFRADKFIYNIFQYKYKRDMERYDIYDLHTVPLYPYANMARDIEYAVAEFVAFAREHLPERFTNEAKKGDI